jgi:hypothetical protein
MKEPVRPATASTPRPQTARALSMVKDMAVDLASDLTDGYRKSTRFSKLRIAVVAAWLVLLVLTCSLMPSQPGSRTNSLGADVQVQETLLGTQIKVENRSERMWTDVTLVLDEHWERQISTLREGQRLVIATSSFAWDGAAAPGDLKPRTLTIRCAQGNVTTTLAGGTP